MWIGFATCPRGLASESGVWAKPQGLAFGFWLGVENNPKKGAVYAQFVNVN